MWKFIAALVWSWHRLASDFTSANVPSARCNNGLGPQHSFKDRRQHLDTTMGIERDLRRRQALIDTKSRVVQAKSDLFEKNFGEAATQLGEAADALENGHEGAKQDEPILACGA